MSTQPPSRSADAPPRRAVHFSQGGIKSGGAGIGAGVAAAIIPTALLGGLALCAAGFFALARFPWIPLAVRATVMAVVFLAAMIALFRLAARGYRRTMSSLKLPMEMNPAAPLNVICWPDQKARLEPQIPAEGDPGYFEPEACRVWITGRKSHAARMQNPEAARRFLIAVIGMQLLLQLAVFGFAHNVLDRAAIGITCVAVGVALLGFVAWGFLCPRFLRVAPGRVDIVKFGFLGSAPTIETIDLRAHPVRLDLRRKELLIGGWHASHPEPEPEPKPDPENRSDLGTDDGAQADDPGPGEPASETDGRKKSAHRKADRIKRFQDMMTQGKYEHSQSSLGSPAQIRALRIVPLWATLDARTLEDALFRAAVSTAQPGPLPDDRLID